ncbi:hypothetical protein BISA_1366 [Bifidobacterium saguini DSM 23967]|uniref:Uncharacterized protein n=1 Tax=Bifidobacterium saguini DSM 23967 TaxID=1437607 RepID=A0A087DCF0_9BIFI|nr:helix-turn-helix domain-containing protein [Bifidobacterium saguini]KFI93200.1 hypothetical protein BISA_1366 [Bifidobacterium saguini DSM 23967]
MADEKQRIIRMLEQGATPQQTARSMNVSLGTIYAIRNETEPNHLPTRRTSYENLRQGIAEWLWNTSLRDEDIEALAGYLYWNHCTPLTNRKGKTQ